MNTLSEIAQDCFGVDTFPSCSDWPASRYVVHAESIIRALESAYDDEPRIGQKRKFSELNHLVIALGIFVGVFGSALGGM